MDNGNKTPNLNLPPPVPPATETAPQILSPEAAQGLEAAPPTSSKEVVTTPAMAIPAMPSPAVTPPTMQTAPPANPSSSTPTIADDNDLIEKEWVLKAKQIVEKTKDDPYNQNKELNVFKADYMKKRYNKTIKLSE